MISGHPVSMHIRRESGTIFQVAVRTEKVMLNLLGVAWVKMCNSRRVSINHIGGFLADSFVESAFPMPG